MTPEEVAELRREAEAVLLARIVRTGEHGVPEKVREIAKAVELVRGSGCPDPS